MKNIDPEWKDFKREVRSKMNKLHDDQRIIAQEAEIASRNAKELMKQFEAIRTSRCPSEMPQADDPNQYDTNYCTPIDWGDKN